MTRPPPTPKSALKKPATRPMTTSRSTARIVWRMDALARLREAPERAAILLDVDGTLAPIVARPEDAAVPEATRAVLRDLVARYALVGAITGRPGDARARAASASTGVEVVGSHGLELAGRRRRVARAARRRSATRSTGRSRTRASRSRTTTARTRTRRGRGPSSRRSPSGARGAGLRARFGRMVLEVLPPLDAHKGTAVRALLEERGLTRALFAGDDTTDLDAFRAVDGARGRREGRRRLGGGAARARSRAPMSSSRARPASSSS